MDVCVYVQEYLQCSVLVAKPWDLSFTFTELPLLKGLPNFSRCHDAVEPWFCFQVPLLSSPPNFYKKWWAWGFTGTAVVFLNRMTPVISRAQWGLSGVHSSARRKFSCLLGCTSLLDCLRKTTWILEPPGEAVVSIVRASATHYLPSYKAWLLGSIFKHLRSHHCRGPPFTDPL